MHFELVPHSGVGASRHLLHTPRIRALQSNVQALNLREMLASFHSRHYTGSLGGYLALAMSGGNDFCHLYIGVSEFSSFGFEGNSRTW